LNLINYAGKNFRVLDNVYLPSDDTYLLLDNLIVEKDDFVLDLGTGCGILGIIASEKADKVVITDISPVAMKCAKLNVSYNDLSDKVDVRLGDLFDPIKKHEKFDLILFNPPYIPVEKEEKKLDWLEKAWDGGKNGREITDKFLEEFNYYLKKRGRVQMIQSSISDYKKTISSLEKKGFKVIIQAEEKFQFEKLVLLLIRK